MAGAAEALAVVPVGILAGLATFAVYINRYVGDWGWLTSWGDRLAFLLWPRPPRNVVKLIHPDGRIDLIYNVDARESKNSVVFETPFGVVKVQPPRHLVSGLNLYVPGRPSPLHFVVGAMAGLLVVYLVLYYGWLLILGMGGLSLAAFAVLGYAYMWYQAAMTPNTIYYPLIVTAVASGFIQAVPAPGEAISPKEFLRMYNQGVKIVVDKEAKEALEEVANMLGVKDISTAAEILSSASMYSTLRKTITSMAARAASISEVQKSISVYTFEELRRVTLGRILAWGVFFVIGVLVGWALFGGGDVVIMPASQELGVAGP
ncbi:hypothetical protein [Aeropyrum globular virus 1]|uniref:hypothetical protein n=1 Tax=Aeropyrum globular virus 1 TaxID=1932713 RepID=UPI000C7F58E3|nr:hypothetical protein C1186_gp07 [Aeropyrum globular virus 1]BBC20933.1 hypothetical protein [Aeropyrum globular virus 1]